MAAHPPPLLPQLHARAVFSGPPRTSSRAYIPCDHVHAAPPKSPIYISASCDIYLHEGSPVEVRASKSSLSKVESSIVGRWEPSIPAKGGFDEASTLGEWDSEKTSTKDFAGSRVKEVSRFDETCTSSIAAAADASSYLPGIRLQTGDVFVSEPCSTNYCLPIPNASTFLTSSDTVEAPQSLSPALAASSQTRSKVVRTAWEALVRWSRSWQLLNARKATNVLQRTKKVVVIGGGSFGTAMAVLLARNKYEMQVSLLLRDSSLCDSINNDHVNRKYFPRHILPNNIVATVLPQEAFKDAEYCIHAVPVQYSADFLKSISEHVPNPC